MAFYAYEGIPDQVLDKQHTTSTGEQYTLRHNETLKVEMAYLGKGNPHANSQGWERDSSKYFKALCQNHPEMFSKKNVARIQEGHAPIVDQKMISRNPSWAQYANQPLVHHHIGGDGEAVAVPKNMHKGQGEIHNQERDAGITENCRNFSKQCGSQKDAVGKTTSQFHAAGQQAANSQKQAANAKTVKQQATTRRDTVRNADTFSKTAKQGTRAAQVRSAVSGSQKGGQRSGAVRAASRGQSAGVSHSGRAASVGGKSAGMAGGGHSASGGGHGASGGGQGR